MEFTVEFYETAEGRSPVQQFLDELKQSDPGDHAAVLLGLSVGFVLGITSAGSGSLIALGLILLFRLSPYKVVGTDIFHAAIVLWAGGIAHIIAGNVDWALAGTILIGSVPGVWLGSHMSVRLPAGTLRTILGVVLIGRACAIGRHQVVVHDLLEPHTARCALELIFDRPEF